LGGVSLANFNNAGQLRLDPAQAFGNTTGLMFGDGDSGFYESSDDVIRVRVAGVNIALFDASTFGSTATGRPGLRWEQSTFTNPTMTPFGGDADSGLGGDGSDTLSMIAGGVEGIRLTEAVGVLQTHQLNAALTADAGSVQGGTPLTSTWNEVATVGTIGDSVTLPTAVTGHKVTIINSAANALDVFPASGDDLGAGGDTAASLAGGANITYLAIDATNWIAVT